MKIGLIRCRQTGEACKQASRCLEAMRRKLGAFSKVEEEIICVGVNSCGGCPGLDAGARAKDMLRLGAEAIVIATCISRSAVNGVPCPFATQFAAGVRQAVGQDVRIFEYSHKEPRKKKQRPEKNCHERHE